MPYKDPVKRKQHGASWHQKNKSLRAKQFRRRKDLIQEEWIKYKSKQKCSHCGFKHHAAIDFHHVVRKNKRSVNSLITKSYNLKKAIEEAETKCIPLCSNCHRIHHWKMREVDRIKRRV